MRFATASAARHHLAVSEQATSEAFGGWVTPNTTAAPGNTPPIPPARAARLPPRA